MDGFCVLNTINPRLVECARLDEIGTFEGRDVQALTIVGGPILPGWSGNGRAGGAGDGSR